MKVRHIFYSLLVSIMLFSCEDAYKVDAADEITDLNAISSVKDLERAMTGVYASVGGNSVIAWSAYFTDECRKPASNRGQGVQVHTWSINDGTTDPDTYYFGFYTTINKANVVLSRIDGINAATPAEVTAKTRIKAELLAIRAMAHFDLLRFFSKSYTNNSGLGVAIVKTPIVSEKLARNTVGEVVSFVMQDLEIAYQDLNTVSNNSNVTRITPLAIQALRARISLYIKDYESAINYANQVIASVPLSNSSNYLDIWNDNASNPEIVFKLKRVQGNNQVGRIFRDSNGDVFYNVSNSLFSEFESDDIRLGTGALLEAGSTPDNLKVGKYSGLASDYGLADIKVFRVAEMYLILSEAQALKASPDLTSAATNLNLLRASRRKTPTALPDLTFSSQEDAIDKILNERRRELAFEGHRFFDLKRFNKGVDRLPSDVLLNSFAEDLPADNFKFTLPIPQAAIFANNKLIQNDGY